MCYNNQNIKVVITFTFNDNDDLSSAFVSELKNKFKNNIYYIDQSTYGINNVYVTLAEIRSLLDAVESDNKIKHNPGDILHVIHATLDESIILNPSFDLNQKYNNVKQ